MGFVPAIPSEVTPKLDLDQKIGLALREQPTIAQLDCSLMANPESGSRCVGAETHGMTL